MRGPPLVLLLLLSASCSARGLSGQDICDQAVQTVTARVIACGGDEAEAEEAGEAIEALGCKVSDTDTGTLSTFAGGWFDCISAMNEAECSEVREHAVEAEWWTSLDFHCPQFIGAATDSGLSP